MLCRLIGRGVEAGSAQGAVAGSENQHQRDDRRGGSDCLQQIPKSDIM